MVNKNIPSLLRASLKHRFRLDSRLELVFTILSEVDLLGFYNVVRGHVFLLDVPQVWLDAGWVVAQTAEEGFTKTAWLEGFHLINYKSL